MLLMAGTATVVVKNLSHPVVVSDNPMVVMYPLGLRGAVPDGLVGPRGAGPSHLFSKPNPNARFAELTPEQRVEQARRHLPESVDDLKK